MLIQCIQGDRRTMTLKDKERSLRILTRYYDLLIGKRILFKPREISKGYFYYDATTKKVGDAYFLKYNKPDEKVLAYDLKSEKGKEPHRRMQMTNVYKKILKNVNNKYKYSHVLHTEVDYKERFDNIKELTEVNVKELLPI